jgi:putative acetyltransferase
MQLVTVHSEQSDDAIAIERVHLSAFETDAEARLIRALRGWPTFDPRLSMVARFHDRVVGHVLLTPVRLQRADEEEEILALAPMAVAPSQSHRGIGSELVQAAIKAAKDLGYGAIVEAGQPEFYLRAGFRPSADFGLRCNLPVQENELTALELRAGGLAGGGNVVYPTPFLDAYVAPQPMRSSVTN